MGTNQRRHKKFIRQSIYILISLAIFLAIIFYGRSIEQRNTHFFVSFKNPNGSVSQEYQLEIADTAGERNKGLMFRKELEPNGGMIFVYPKEDVQAFWMKNTHVSLDMVFMDRNWNVVGVIPRVPILNLESRKVDKPSIYVAELLAGSAEKDGIVVGSKAQFNIPPVPAKD